MIETDNDVLVIDDEKTLYDRHCRTFDEGVEALKERRWRLLLLDHDLGDPDWRKTGCELLKWLGN